MKQIRTTTSLSYYAYLWPVVFLLLVGLVNSIYLAISHFRIYTDIDYKSFCAISRAINCDTVSQSPYAIMLNIPVAIWGILGYAFILVLLLFTRNNSTDRVRIWSIIFWLMLVFSAFSVILALISSYFIRSYCILCILSYGVNLALLFYTWLIRRRFSRTGLVKETQLDILFLWQNKTKSILLFTVFLVILISTWAFLPKYWTLRAPLIFTDMPTGFTEFGYPWIGAEDAVLEITEFADYQCFQCRKMHFFLRQLINENPGKIRIIHRHYPMDHEINPIVAEPFHVGSGKLALLAVYAASKNKFWEMNDLLYELSSQKKPIATQELAKALSIDNIDLAGALNDRIMRLRLKHDIYSGNKLGITGTPAYIINDEVYQGQIPSKIIKGVLE